MTMNVAWGESPEGVTFFIQLNEQGFVKYAYEIDHDTDGDSTDEWWFEYDAQGRLITMKRTEGNNEVTTVTYDAAGNISRIDMKSDPDPENPYDKTSMWATTEYTDSRYGSMIANIGGIMLYDETFRIDMDEMAPAFYAGILGRATTSLPVRTVEDDGYVYTFTWTLNGSGLPGQFDRESKNADGNPESTDHIDFVW